MAKTTIPKQLLPFHNFNKRGLSPVMINDTKTAKQKQNKETTWLHYCKTQWQAVTRTNFTGNPVLLPLETNAAGNMQLGSILL